MGLSPSLRGFETPSGCLLTLWRPSWTAAAAVTANLESTADPSPGVSRAAVDAQITARHTPIAEREYQIFRRMQTAGLSPKRRPTSRTAGTPQRKTDIAEQIATSHRARFPGAQFSKKSKISPISEPATTALLTSYFQDGFQPFY